MLLFEFGEWGSSKRAGVGYGGQVGERWCSILETRGGSHRGDHTHTVDQFTVLLKGKASVVAYMGGEFRETPLRLDRVHMTPAGVPHVTLAYRDSVAYEWWDGASSMQPCGGLFKEVLDAFRAGIAEQSGD